jgi:hypothetical protein
MIESIKPIFQQKYSYSEMETLLEEIDNNIREYEKSGDIPRDARNMPEGTFEVIVNWYNK